MKIKGIQLSWFRGAADPVLMDLNSKSLAVYGENGAGKSSFVDAIEYIINDGRIIHLAHEHSGRRQEKAIGNTHTPGSQNGEIVVMLDNKSEVRVEIQKKGTFTINPKDSEISKWDYQRTILRQNELADFIKGTKGEKYSALLPLLGLNHLEIAAENLRKLKFAITQQTNIDGKYIEIRKIQERKELVFGEIDNDGIETVAKELFLKLCKTKEVPSSLKNITEQALFSLEQQIDRLSVSEKEHSVLLEITALNIISAHIDGTRKSASKLAGSVEPLVVERLNALRAASLYVKKIEDGTEIIDCPACGRPIANASFQSHIETEEERLKEAIEAYETHKVNVSMLCDSLQSLKTLFSKEIVNEWKSTCETTSIEYLESLQVDKIRSSCIENELQNIEQKLLPLIAIAQNVSQAAPVGLKELLNDQQQLKMIDEILVARNSDVFIKKIEDLLGFIGNLERGYRDRIRSQSSEVVGAISADVAKMWGILHPNEKVENVHLSIPSDVDKAIEINLKFYGVDQESPRLTLSEGHRNSLGLCIFLSMVKRDTNSDCPIFLDDVVVSFDRNHRGMVANLLRSEFADRQIILLTHDREWYIELKQQLPSKNWEFKVLMPWESPDIGIRFSSRQYTFDDARAFLGNSPDSAGNTARKIMDISMAILSEPLRVDLPYLHRERNDHRTAHEFLEKVIAISPSTFSIKKNGSVYEPFSEAVDCFKKADSLLLSWANRGSHTFDLTQNEAKELIDACESALTCFTCVSCKKSVTILHNIKAQVMQCECGNLKWKY